MDFICATAPVFESLSAQAGSARRVHSALLMHSARLWSVAVAIITIGDASAVMPELMHADVDFS